MIWFASWLVDDDGGEGGWVHSARGAARLEVSVPSDATGLRVRRWPSDGFDAEYADLTDLGSVNHIDAGALDFDVRQRFSLLAEDFGEENPWGLSRYAAPPTKQDQRRST